jgi:hypothetical protein
VPTSDAVGDRAPEERPDEHAREGRGRQEPGLGGRQGEVLADGGEGEGDQEHLRGIGCPGHTADQQQAPLEAAKPDLVDRVLDMQERRRQARAFSSIAVRRGLRLAVGN